MAKKYFYTILFFIGVVGVSTAFAQDRIQPNDVRYSTQSIEGLSIYPNPVMNNSKIFIESNKNSSKEVELYNVVGKKIFTATLNTKELVLPYSVNAGIYIMKIKEENATATRKIIVK